MANEDPLAELLSYVKARVEFEAANPEAVTLDVSTKLGANWWLFLGAAYEHLKTLADKVEDGRPFITSTKGGKLELYLNNDSHTDAWFQPEKSAYVYKIFMYAGATAPIKGHKPHSAAVEERLEIGAIVISGDHTILKSPTKEQLKQRGVEAAKGVINYQIIMAAAADG